MLVKTVAGWSAVGLGLAVLLAGSNLAAQVPALVTNVFQNGIGGYTGEIDASISTQNADSTEGNGLTRFEEWLMVWLIEYEARALIRFDNLVLPPGAAVQSATLRLTFNSWAEGFTVAGYYLKVPWNPLATGDYGLGWLHRDLGVDWSTPGALGLGTDVLADKSFSFSGFQGGGENESKSVALDPELVQTWVNDPAANRGLLLVQTVSNVTCIVGWAGALTIPDRPSLTIIYRPGVPPTVAQTAAAAPNPVTSTTNLLSVLGADPGGETNLTYTWSAVSKPALAPEPLFSPNALNSAKQSTATYSKAGDYSLQVIIRNRGGLTATSTVAVAVQSTLSSIAVSPASTQVITNASLAFRASALDQFGDPLALQPGFAWSVTGGGGINSTGLFTAAAVPGGPYLVRAEYGGKTGTASVAVRLPNQLPLVRLSSPTNGQTFVGQPLTGWTNLPIAAEASDADGTVAKVEFYQNSNKLGECSTTPYGLVWSNAAPGVYELTARAWDNEGVCSTSAPVAITVETPPSPVEPFFAAPQPSGTLAVQLYPTEGVTGNRLVTFGIPFPRGSVGTNDLGRIRVLRAGEEVPAYVDALTPWRQARSPALDGTSLRVARIQIHHSFSTVWPDPELVTVEWGMSNRTANLTTLENPRSAWHQVTNGTFQPSDNVWEPDVLPVLPKAHLCLGFLKPARMAPLDEGVPATREDPALMRAIDHWPAYLELDHAVHNFFFTLINHDDPRVAPTNQCPYRTDFEPWLYDRASALFLLYFRSGQVQALREAIRATQFYYTQLYPGTATPESLIGLFKLKVPTPDDNNGGNSAMYSYNECLAYDYWLCGDTTVLPAIDWVVHAQESNSDVTRWSPELYGWTERHTAFRLLASLIAYEVSGTAACKSNLLSQTADFLWHQNGAGGLLPGNRVDGGLYHYGSQHGDGIETNLVASSWMTVLTLDAMLRAYAVTEDPAIADFIRRLGTFWKAACKTDLNHQYDIGIYEYMALCSPDYMMTYDGTSDPRDGRQYEMVDHALDVGSGLAWASYFAAALDQPDPSLARTSNTLYFTYDIGVNYWTRPDAPASAGKPAYRVSPWRKYGWEHRLSGSLPWLLSQPALAPQPSLDLASDPADGLQLTFSGGLGLWRIESSETLTNWTTLTTVSNFVVPTCFSLPASAPRQFYRAVSP